MDSCSNSRRDFLKTSALGAAGMMAAGGIMKKARAAWSPRMAINPNISNLRVVCCHDPSMIKNDPTSWTFTNQNAAVDKDKVHANLDAMAKTLAQKSTATEAWATIFRKPATKQWSQVKVAIKVNSLNPNIMSRTAIVGKMCMVMNSLGVPYANMIVYDGGHHHPTNYMVQYQPFIGNDIPAGVAIMGITNLDLMHGTTNVDVVNYGPIVPCVTDIANGTYDIIINIAVNKGHGCPGKATLAMKNHLGTFHPAVDHGEPGKPGWGTYIESVNKSDPIVGGDPVRQQLCIIDSLWGNSYGVQEAPDCTPARLIMGTFAPVIDYLTIIKLRIPVMGSYVWEPENPNNGNSVCSMATSFGYTLAEYQALNFVMVGGGSVDASHQAEASQESMLTLKLASKHFKPVQVSVPIQLSGQSWKVSVMDLKGRTVWESVTRGNLKSGMTITWSGNTQSGMQVPEGTYAVKVTSGTISKSVSIGCIRS